MPRRSRVVCGRAENLCSDSTNSSPMASLCHIVLYRRNNRILRYLRSPCPIYVPRVASVACVLCVSAVSLYKLLGPRTSGERAKSPEIIAFRLAASHPTSSHARTRHTPHARPPSAPPLSNMNKGWPKAKPDLGAWGRGAVFFSIRGDICGVSLSPSAPRHTFISGASARLEAGAYHSRPPSGLPGRRSGRAGEGSGRTTRAVPTHIDPAAHLVPHEEVHMARAVGAN